MEKNFNSQGFTLLETMIAMAIMLVAFSSILMVESSSINTIGKATQMSVVAMLAKNLMVETEIAIEGKSFSEVSKEDKGDYPEPYKDYRWTRVVKELTFPKLNLGGGAKEGDKGGSAEESPYNAQAEMLTQLFSKFLSQSIREVTITIFWKRGTGEQSYSLSTYWVDLNHEFSLTP